MRTLRAVIILAILVSASFAEDAPRRLVQRVDPEYPELAKRMNASGTVRLELLVSKQGNVKTVTVLGGNPVLILAAEDAAKKWRYAPGPECTQGSRISIQARTIAALIDNAIERSAR